MRSGSRPPPAASVASIGRVTGGAAAAFIHCIMRSGSRPAPGLSCTASHARLPGVGVKRATRLAWALKLVQFELYKRRRLAHEYNKLATANPI